MEYKHLDLQAIARKNDLDEESFIRFFVGKDELYVKSLQEIPSFLVDKVEKLLVDIFIRGKKDRVETLDAYNLIKNIENVHYNRHLCSQYDKFNSITQRENNYENIFNDYNKISPNKIVIVSRFCEDTLKAIKDYKFFHPYLTTLTGNIKELIHQNKYVKIQFNPYKDRENALGSFNINVVDKQDIVNERKIISSEYEFATWMDEQLRNTSFTYPECYLTMCLFYTCLCWDVDKTGWNSMLFGSVVLSDLFAPQSNGLDLIRDFLCKYKTVSNDGKLLNNCLNPLYYTHYDDEKTKCFITNDKNSFLGEYVSFDDAINTMIRYKPIHNVLYKYKLFHQIYYNFEHQLKGRLKNEIKNLRYKRKYNRLI